MADSPRLSRLDLNLLVALDALLTEKSVTRAAERLGLSQPSLSASLARLRTHFDDPLLARRGNSYELTPLARRLGQHTATAIDATRRVFETQTEWTPESAEREFSVYGSDHTFATLGRLVSAYAAEEAPQVSFRFMLHNPTIVEDAHQRLRSADGMVLPHGYLTGLPHTDLDREGWVILASDDNPALDGGLTMDALAASDWVLTFQSRSAFTPPARQLQQLGIEPRVAAIVESFLAMPYFIAGTGRLGLLQSSLAPIAAGVDGIRVVEPPFEATPILNALWWDPVHETDPEHRWMRSLFARAASVLQSERRLLSASG